MITFDFKTFISIKGEVLFHFSLSLLKMVIQKKNIILKTVNTAMQVCETKQGALFEKLIFKVKTGAKTNNWRQCSSPLIL